MAATENAKGKQRWAGRRRGGLAEPRPPLDLQRAANWIFVICMFVSLGSDSAGEITGAPLQSQQANYSGVDNPAGLPPGHRYRTMGTRALREEARRMYFHGFDSYMRHAYPLDELDPIHCTGRGVDRERPSNININDVLGNYSLTLIDSLDTLAVMGEWQEFHRWGGGWGRWAG